MKNLSFTLFIFFTLFTNLSAQEAANLVYGSQHFNGGTDITIISNDRWYLSGTTGGGAGFVNMNPLIGAYDNGEWSEDDIAELINYQGELVKLSPFATTPDFAQNYFVVGQEVCDVILPNLLVALGEELFWSVEIDGFYASDYALAAIPNDGVIWAEATDDKLYWQRSAEEQIDLSAGWPEGEPIQRLEFWRPGVLLAQSENRLYAIALSTLGIEIWRTFEFDDPPLHFTVLNQQEIAIVQTDSLIKMSSGLLPIDGLILDGEGTPHLDADSTKLYLLQNLADDQYAFFYDHELEEEARVPLQLNDYLVSGMAANAGRIALTGVNYFIDYSSTPEPRNSQAFIRTYTAAGPDTEPQHDLAVESMTYNDTNFGTNPWNGCIFGEVRSIQVTVRNQGPIPINQIILKFETDICNGICDGYLTRTFPFSGFNLQPGESIILPIDVLNVFQLFPAEERNFCISATAPGHPMEVNLDNNTACQSIIIVNADELAPDEMALSIYPNPATDQLSINWPVGAESLTIYNAQGQVMREVDSPQATVYQLDLTHFPAGLYFVNVKTPKTVLNGSFIRQ